MRSNPTPLLAVAAMAALLLSGCGQTGTRQDQPAARDNPAADAAADSPGRRPGVHRERAQSDRPAGTANTGAAITPVTATSIPAVSTSGVLSAAAASTATVPFADVVAEVGGFASAPQDVRITRDIARRWTDSVGKAVDEAIKTNGGLSDRGRLMLGEQARDFGVTLEAALNSSPDGYAIQMRDAARTLEELGVRMAGDTSPEKD